MQIGVEVIETRNAGRGEKVLTILNEARQGCGSAYSDEVMSNLQVQEPAFTQH